MQVLVRKMSSFGILRVQRIFGAIVMIAAMIALPASVATTDASLLLNPYVFGVVGAGMLMFAAFAYFLFIRPYFVYRKSPEVLAESDGEYLYIHGKKEIKIPLADLDGAVVTYHLPFVYAKEFVAALVAYFFSENYGDLDLDVPGYGSYRLRFVSNVQATANALVAFLSTEQSSR